MMRKIILLLTWMTAFYYLCVRTKIVISACVQPEYQEIQKMYMKNLTSTYPDYIIEGYYYWTKLSKTLCTFLGAFWAFNLYKLFSGFNIFKTLGIDMFWNTINIRGCFLSQRLTLFLNKLALLVFTGTVIAFCFLELPNYSSAFEVSINNELVWSKLQTGNIPTLDHLHDIISFELPRIQAQNSVFCAGLGLVLFILSKFVEDEQPPRRQSLRRIQRTPHRAIW